MAGLDDLKYYVIGIILMITVITGGMFWLGSFNTSNPVIDSSNKIGDFSNAINSSSGVTVAVNNMGNSVSSLSTGGVGVLGWINGLISSVFYGIKAMFTSFSFVGVMTTELSLMLGIPSTMVTLILLITIVILIFSIWAVATGRA